MAKKNQVEVKEQEALNSKVTPQEQPPVEQPPVEQPQEQPPVEQPEEQPPVEQPPVTVDPIKSLREKAIARNKAREEDSERLLKEQLAKEESEKGGDSVSIG